MKECLMVLVARSRIIRLADSDPEFKADYIASLRAAAAGGNKKVWKTPAGNWRAKNPSGNVRSFGSGSDAKDKAERYSRGESVHTTTRREEYDTRARSAPATLPRELGDLLGDWHSSSNDPIYQISSKARSGQESTLGEARDALKEVSGWLNQWDTLGPRAGWTESDKKELEDAKLLLQGVIRDALVRQRDSEGAPSETQESTPTPDNQMTGPDRIVYMPTAEDRRRARDHVGMPEIPPNSAIDNLVRLHAEVGSNVRARDLTDAHRELDWLVRNPDNPRYTHWYEKFRDNIRARLTNAGERTPNTPSSRPSSLPSLTPARRPIRVPGVRVTPQVEEVVERYSLEDDDIKQLKKWKREKPDRGRAIDMAEKKRRFLLKAKPETRERMQGMTLADFAVMYNSIMAEDEEDVGMGRAAAFRAELIHVAHANPEFREHIFRVILAKGNMDDGLYSSQYISAIKTDLQGAIGNLSAARTQAAKGDMEQADKSVGRAEAQVKKIRTSLERKVWSGRRPYGY